MDRLVPVIHIMNMNIGSCDNGDLAKAQAYCTEKDYHDKDGFTERVVLSNQKVSVSQMI